MCFAKINGMKNRNNIITLTTDFNETDGFAGVMKGVILSINPEAKIIDISHQVPSQNIEAAAFLFYNSYDFFPEGTTHVIVVDPGVGSQRRIIAAQSKKYIFIAPDNKVLNYIFNSDETLTVVNVLNKKYFLPKISNTFHGRDIFAPVAAHLSMGLTIKELGPAINDYNNSKIPTPIISSKKIIGNVIYIDKFGNLITNIHQSLISNKNISIKFKKIVINNLSNSYTDVKINEPLAIIGSSGYLEVSIRNGDACKNFNISIKDPIEVMQ